MFCRWWRGPVRTARMCGLKCDGRFASILNETRIACWSWWPVSFKRLLGTWLIDWMNWCFGNFICLIDWFVHYVFFWLTMTVLFWDLSWVSLLGLNKKSSVWLLLSIGYTRVSHYFIGDPNLIKWHRSDMLLAPVRHLPLPTIHVCPVTASAKSWNAMADISPHFWWHFNAGVQLSHYAKWQWSPSTHQRTPEEHRTPENTRRTPKNKEHRRTPEEHRRTPKNTGISCMSGSVDCLISLVSRDFSFFPHAFRAKLLFLFCMHVT